MSVDNREDVNDVLNDVIDKINRITDHVREKGENEAASRFTREMTHTLRELYHIIAPWDIDKCLMKNETKMTGPLQGTTWAAIAATEPSMDKSGVVKFRPGQTMQAKASQLRGGHATTYDDASAQRVAWIRPWTADRPLQEITDKMQSLGPIYSIAFAPEAGAVCIIFQQAKSASDFMDRFGRHVDHKGRPILKTPYEVAPGLPYAATRELNRMNPPYNERRRLTFARAGLFTKDGVTQKQFKGDIESLVGTTNVELLWFFNSGNATVVFSAVPLAKVAREAFLRYGCSQKSPYHDIQVSYSHDPCERDMHLVSQIPGHPGYIGGGSASTTLRARGNTFGSSASGHGYGSGGGACHAPGHKRRITGSNGAKPNMDNDGWQTVKKRR